MMVVASAPAGEPTGEPAGEQKVLQEALQIYGKRLTEEREAVKSSGPGFNRTSFPIFVPGQGAQQKPEQIVRAELERDLSADTDSTEPPSRDDADSDGETFEVCHHCRLPLGQAVYAAGDDEDDQTELLHGECKAQRLVSDLRAREAARRREAADLKKSRHEEFDIGWKPELIPRNEQAAEKLACGVVPKGMCSLVLRGDGAVEVAPTLEPAGAVNLEYLSLALQVRRCEGTEPLFSLDPIESKKPGEDPEASMQMKVFEPEWLAGTSVGEVMFQADYHLKELSMGAYEQPVVGMQSCFDAAEGDKEDWSGREWFIVRKAEIHVSDDNVVIPFLKMGVEAREQVMGPQGMEDAPMTRPNHPLVKYAEAFTQNFDLIAERKGVVYQLREVAKASILAKFLLESGLRLEERWFEMAPEPSPACCLEVPQLWNDRLYSSISIEDGRIVQFGNGNNGSQSIRGVYGGVDFGIDRFRLTAPSRVATSVVAGRAALGRPASTLMATSRAGLSVGPARQFSRLAGPLSSMSMGVPSKVSAPLGAMSMAGTLRSAISPQGVDLSLDKFNLSAPAQVGVKMTSPNANLSIGGAFWSELSNTCDSAFSDEDKGLFREVFNPFLSDRRAEGDLFAPPPTSHAHIQSLRRLVKEEEAVRQRRKDHFCSNRFVMDDAGPLFPASWTQSLKATVAADHGLAQGNLTARPEFKGQAEVLRGALAAATPVFDRCTEDGARFRIYRFGSLEVRTTQEHAGEEAVGVVFSVGAAPAQNTFAQRRGLGPTENDKVWKATEYVQRVAGARTSYVVLETAEGHSILTERLRDGTVAWKENPADLELRNSLAKVIRSKVCMLVGTTVGDMKKLQISQHARRHEERDSASACKRYAQLAYSKAAADVARGFRRPSKPSDARMRVVPAPRWSALRA